MKAKESESGQSFVPHSAAEEDIISLKRNNQMAQRPLQQQLMTVKGVSTCIIPPEELLVSGSFMLEEGHKNKSSFEYRKLLFLMSRTPFLPDKADEHGGPSRRRNSRHYRCVNDIKSSGASPSSALFIVAYGALIKLPNRSSSSSSATNSSSSFSRSSSSSSSEGLIIVWSLSSSFDTPKLDILHVMEASSPVTSAIFHPKKHHLIIGGCASGQITLWEITIPSSSSSTPVQKSRLATVGRGHHTSIILLAVTTKSQEMMSVDVDGMLCSWDVNSPLTPITTSSIFPPSAKNINIKEDVFSSFPLDSSLQISTICCTFESRSKEECFQSLVVGSTQGKLLQLPLPFRSSTDDCHQVANQTDCF